MSVLPSPLQVGIIGYGLAGAVFHAPVIASVPGFRVAAIATRSIEKQELARRDFPDISVYDSVEACVADRSLDIIVVATPNTTHISFGRMALEEGKHVVIEKPFAPSVAEAQSLIDVAQRSNRLLSVFHNRRWDGDFLTVQRLLQTGMLGSVYSFESRFESYSALPLEHAWYEQETQAGGVLYNLGPHLIDQALLLFGTVESVYAEVETRRPAPTADDVTFVALAFHNGVRAKLYMNDVARISGPRFQVRGLLGAFEKYGLDPQEEKLKAGSRPSSSEWGCEASAAWGRMVTEVAGLKLHVTVETLPGCYQCYYEQLRMAILGNAPVPVDPVDAIAGLRIIEAAQQSAREGKVLVLQ